MFTFDAEVAEWTRLLTPFATKSDRARAFIATTFALFASLAIELTPVVVIAFLFVAFTASRNRVHFGHVAVDTALVIHHFIRSVNSVIVVNRRACIKNIQVSPFSFGLITNRVVKINFLAQDQLMEYDHKIGEQDEFAWHNVRDVRQHFAKTGRFFEERDENNFELLHKSFG